MELQTMTALELSKKIRQRQVKVADGVKEVFDQIEKKEGKVHAYLDLYKKDALARAKEVQKIADGLIALGVKEKDNFETVKVTAKVAVKDKDGKRVKEVVDGKKVTVYDEVQKEIKKDQPSRLHARRQMLKVFYPVTEVPAAAAGKKKNTKKIDMPAKVFDEIAPKYADRKGGYTRIVKIGQRKGDGAMEVVLELI